jgi:predicted nucleotidyltransferase
LHFIQATCYVTATQERNLWRRGKREGNSTVKAPRKPNRSATTHRIEGNKRLITRENEKNPRHNPALTKIKSGNIAQPMRLTTHQTQTIRQLAQQVGGAQTRVRVFGSRLDDNARGGDVDLMLELPAPVDNPALMAARMSALVSRAMRGRKVDVLISAPNLKCLPIHNIAFEEGQLL